MSGLLSAGRIATDAEGLTSTIGSKIGTLIVSIGASNASVLQVVGHWHNTKF
jgi:hypothetical protein